jgi:NADPH2:quinone reductase
MRAWRVQQLGEPAEALRLDIIAPPEPGAGEVVIDVSACALNFPDVLLCRGEYQEKPALPFTPGLEVAGTVAGVGPGSSHEVGERVLASPLLPHGGLADRTVALDADVFAVPDALDDASAAALHVTYQTGWFGLYHRAQLRQGETLLVHAGAGGVGSAAIQLGLAAGARVIATAGGAEKVQICRELGAEIAIDYRSEDFVEVVKDATDGRGADVIYDSVGGDTFDRSRKCIAFEGRILVIGFAGGRFADAPTNHVLIKNYSIVGLHWALYKRYEPSLVVRCHDELLGLHGRGLVSPLISSQRPLEEAHDALTELARRGTWGKVVLRT